MFFSEKIINKTYKNFFITYKKMPRFCHVFEKKCNVFATFLKKFATFCTNPCGNPTYVFKGGTTCRDAIVHFHESIEKFWRLHGAVGFGS